jgi:adenylate cyclase class 2
MKEIEVKILDVNRSEMEAKLLELGAILHFDGELSAVFFDFPDKRIRESKGVLRLRKEGEKVMLTHKTQLSQEGVKIMDEKEVSVGEAAKMQEILLNLGMEIVKSTRKIRAEYLLGTAKVLFDDYKDELDFIPVFIEIEAHSEEEVYAIAEKLGYKREDCNSWNTWEVTEHYKKLSN